jgi:hypothetical protein
MRLNAITLGYAVPARTFNASIRSTFRSAANLKLEGDWELLTLVASSEADVPRGIRVDTPDGFTFEDLRVAQPVICRDGIVRFGNASLEVDLRRAQRWDFDLSTCKFERRSPRVFAAWQFAWRKLNDRQLASGAEMVGSHLLHPQAAQGSATVRRLADGMTLLLRATASYDLSASTAVSPLIGLGQGVTPTGDDLLVGYIAGLWCTIGNDEKRREYASILGKTLIDLGRKTTDISRSYLYHAGLGRVSSRLAGLAEAVCKGMDASELDAIANAAMSVGHTSGMDAVTGLLLGLAAWDRDSLI